MPTIVTRASKGSPLTWTEADNNFKNLNYSASISVKDSAYGAKGDGIADDTAAIQAAITAAAAHVTGASVFFPAGVYKITATININNMRGVYLRGDGEYSTTIKPSASVTTAFAFAGMSDQGISDMLIDCTNTTSCIGISIAYLDTFYLSTVKILYASTGIKIDNCIVQFFNDFQVNMSKVCGISINNGSDLYFNNGLMSNAGATQPSLAGMLITQTGGVWVSNVDFISQRNGLLLAPDAGQEVFWLFFTNSAFDTCSDSGIKITPNHATATVMGSTFTGCWTSTNLVGVNITGVGNVDGIRFIGHRSYNNSQDGYVLGSGGLRNNISFNNCDASGNSTASPGTSSGFVIGQDVSGFSITNCRSGQQTNHGNTQQRGILVIPGTSDNYLITGNDLRTNTSVGLVDGGTGTNKMVRDNLNARTSQSGQAKILIGNTYITVPHSLMKAPNVVVVTPYYGNLGGASFWVSDETTSSFRINIATAQAVDIPWMWYATTDNY